MKQKWFVIIIALIISLMASVVFAVSVGAVSLPFIDTFKLLLSMVLTMVFSIINVFSRILTGESLTISNDFLAADISSAARTIILSIRLPRVILSLMVGAALAIAGVSFQGILRNPLADPYTIGVSSGAAVGATLGMLIRGGQGTGGMGLSLPLFALIGGLLALGAVYSLARTSTRLPVVTLLLAGVVVSSFLSAIISLTLIFAGEQMQGIFFWIAGGFVMRNWNHVFIMAPYLILGSLVLFYFSRDLNVILLGEEEAQGLGIDVEKTKKIVLLAASLLTSAAVAVSGMIGFVGLIIPHAVRMFTGPDHRRLLPASALAGSTFLILADVLARTLLAPREIPVGILTAFFGAPFFMYLLVKKKKDFRF